jgi:spore maturation protein CgeB
LDKLIILDGIAGVPLGREIHEAFVAQGVAANYLDSSKLTRIRCYGLRSKVAKLINRSKQKGDFYHLPMINGYHVKRLLEHEKPTHVLVIGFIYKFINPTLLADYCRDLNIRLFLYDTDSCNLYEKRREFIFFIENELPIYDEIFSFSKVTTNFFKFTKNLNASHMPFGAKVIANQLGKEKKYDVLFVGSADLRRIFLLEHIKERVKIYGNRWTRNFPLISSDLKLKIEDKSVWGSLLHEKLAEAKIVLNITRGPFFSAETGVNLRIFEALSAGSFLLTDYCDELAEMFVIGEEIEVFRGADELVEKVDFYLKNPKEREAIAKKGNAKFLAKYTWDQRVKFLVDKMGLNPD